MEVIEFRHGRWRVRYRDVDGVMVSESGFATKAAARKWIADNPWPDDEAEQAGAHGVG